MSPTPQQQATLDWMRRTRPASKDAPAAMLVYLGGVIDGQAAVIFPNGSYRTASLGQIHDAPRLRLVPGRDHG